MRVLGIDTATWRASVAVLAGETLLSEASEHTAGKHAATLLPLIESVLQQASCTVADLDRIAVSSGPGSFTGLRVGLSVAKALAWSAGTALSTVPTLEALAHGAGVDAGTVASVLDARKGELYAAVFRFSGGSCARETEDLLLTPEDLLARLPAGCTVIGDAVERYAGLFRERLGDSVRLLEFPEHGPRGSVVARLGARGPEYRGAALAAVEPGYLRPPDAQLPRS